jgi:molybdopterin molybdotransferase
MAIGPDDALAMILGAMHPLDPIELPAEDCLGLVLAADIAATADLPPFDRAMMDGWAVRLQDAGGEVAILDEIAAGDGADRPPVATGCAHPIMTGAPVPPGAEAVVPCEQAERSGQRVRLPERIKAGANIVPRGAECRAGSPWAQGGGRITALTLAAAIGVGALRLPVVPRPRVTIIATGAELSDDPGAGCIRDSNGPMLAALLAEAGFSTKRLRAGDDGAGIADAVAGSHGDAVVLTGGVSAGTHDEVPQALHRLGAETILRAVAQKPGKPLLVARIGAKPVFALPGNPLAAHLCCCRYVIPALRRLAGRDGAAATGAGILAVALPAGGDRTWFVPALVVDRAVTPLLPRSSADLVAPHRANAYLRVDPGAPAQPVGAAVGYVRIGADP